MSGRRTHDRTWVKRVQVACHRRAGAAGPKIGGRSARVGITAGASAPEVLVQDVVQRLRELAATGLEHLEGKPEDVVFALPKELRIQLVS